MHVYHVVTERPMHLGQQILFDEQNKNGVANRVASYFAIEAGKTTICNYVNVHPICEEVRKNPEKWKNVAYRENALEEVRQKSFPDYPSRTACLYTTQTLDEAKSWARFFHELGRTVYSIAILEVNGRIFTGDACNCFDGTDNHAANQQQALDYWNIKKTKAPVWETLVDGIIHVIELIDVTDILKASDS